MRDIVYAELLKLKRSKLLWLVLIGGLLPAFLEFFVANNMLQHGSKVTWDELLGNDMFMLAFLMAPALFALFAGYVFAREYQERTINPFLTVPRNRQLLLAGKLIALLALILATIVLAALLIWLAGVLLKLAPIPAGTLVKYGKLYALLTAMEFALVPAAAACSIVGKGYIPAMSLGVFAVVSSLTIINSDKYNTLYPWSVPAVLLNLLARGEGGTAKFIEGAAALAVAFVVPLVFCLVHYRKADVHSG